MTRQTLENRIHRKLLSLGWQVQRTKPIAEGWHTGRTYWQPDYLKRLNFHPKTIVDVGVGYGTPHLYEAFPEAHLLLIEPVAEFQPAVTRILSKRQGTHVSTAIGAQPGIANLHVIPTDPQNSSLFERGPLEQDGAPRSTRPIPIQTLDQVLGDHPCPRPYGVKIDTEGAELEVIEGATETLRHTEFVIAEVAVPPRFDGGYDFAQYIAAMDRHGFAVCDILDIGRSPDSTVTFLDLVFRNMR